MFSHRGSREGEEKYRRSLMNRKVSINQLVCQVITALLVKEYVRGWLSPHCHHSPSHHTVTTAPATSLSQQPQPPYCNHSHSHQTLITATATKLSQQPQPPNSNHSHSHQTVTTATAIKLSQQPQTPHCNIRNRQHNNTTTAFYRVNISTSSGSRTDCRLRVRPQN